MSDESHLRRRIERERAARKQAEELLEQKSRQLYASNLALTQARDELEQRVRERTEQLNEARLSAEAANRAKSEFLTNMSHEIRTPMTAILGFAEVLRSHVQNDEAAKALHTISRNGQHLLSVINGILDLSKIEAGEVRIEQLPCSPHELLLDIEELFRPEALEKRLDWRVKLLAPIPVSIRTDPTRLKQVLVNLVGNAMKFTGQGSVTLDATIVDAAEEPKLVFTITDTGIGISPEQLTKIFRPFSQADASMTRRYGGTGLGLAITQQFVTMLGGTISVDSTPEVGSQFTVYLPVGTTTGVHRSQQLERNDVRPVAATEPVRQAPAMELIGLKVLLVEDGRDNQTLFRHILTRAGAKVTIADNGKIGSDLALSTSGTDAAFDVILMDMQMPVMDGYTASRWLRDRNYKGPIVALTAHATERERERTLAAGCTTFASKPIDRASLIRLVHQVATSTHDRVVASH